MWDVKESGIEAVIGKLNSAWRSGKNALPN